MFTSPAKAVCGIRFFFFISLQWLWAITRLFSEESKVSSLGKIWSISAFPVTMSETFMGLLQYGHFLPCCSNSLKCFTYFLPRLLDSQYISYNLLLFFSFLASSLEYLSRFSAPILISLPSSMVIWEGFRPRIVIISFTYFLSSFKVWWTTGFAILPYFSSSIEV